MKFCTHHWTMLRDAIDAKGLGSLVSDDGREVAGKLNDQVQNGPRVDNFDPLFQAHSALVGNVVRMVGPVCLFANDDGSERCPICYLNADHEKHCAYSECGLARVDGYDVWIETAAEEQLAIWKTFAL